MGQRYGIVGTEIESRGELEEAGAPGLCWPGFAFDRRRVRELGVPAYCWTADGDLWEYEDETFFVTGPADRGLRRRAGEEDAPPEGWSHPADCACPACRVEKH